MNFIFRASEIKDSLCVECDCQITSYAESDIEGVSCHHTHIQGMMVFFDVQRIHWSFLMPLLYHFSSILSFLRSVPVLDISMLKNMIIFCNDVKGLIDYLSIFSAKDHIPHLISI